MLPLADAGAAAAITRTPRQRSKVPPCLSQGPPVCPVLVPVLQQLSCERWSLLPLSLMPLVTVRRFQSSPAEPETPIPSAYI